MGMLDDLLLSAHLRGPKTGLLANMPGEIPPPMADPDAPEPEAGPAVRPGSILSKLLGNNGPSDPNAGAYRPGSPLESLFGGGPAQPSSNPADYKGLEDAFGPPPSTNDPQSGEPKLVNVPLPRKRPDNLAGDYEGLADAFGSVDKPGAPLSLAPQDYQDQTPANAAPAQGQAPDSVGGGEGPFDKLGKFAGKLFNPDHAATWLALGSGFSGAGSIGTGMRRAAAAAVPAVQADRLFAQKQSTISDTYRALVAKGVPPADALAASQNPDIMKTIAAKYFEGKPSTPHVLGTDMMGNPIQGIFDPNMNAGKGGFRDAAGTAIGTGGGGDNSSIIGSGAGMLAKGVKEYNSELPAEEYLNQFSPEVKAAIENYAHGDTMPTGNPRLKGFTSKIKEWAQTWGNKAGVEVSDTAFSAKRKMRTDLAASSPNSAGGILSNGKSAFAHLANAGDEMVNLGNRNGPDVAGGGHIAHAANYVGNALLPTSETMGKVAAINDNLGKYGAEATKFYAGTGGSAEERLAGLKHNDPTTQSGKEQAAFLRVEKNLMLERLTQKEAQVREQLGEKYLQDHPIRTPDLEQNIARIDANIKRLEAGPSPARAAPPPGNYVYDPATKQLVPAK